MGGRNPAPPTVYIYIYAYIVWNQGVRATGWQEDQGSRRGDRRRSLGQWALVRAGPIHGDAWEPGFGADIIMDDLVSSVIITIVIVNTWVPSKTQICVFAGFWDVAVPTTILVFVSRSCPAPNCGCWSACFFNFDWPCAVNNTRNLIISYLFFDLAHWPITKTFYLRYPCWYHVADPSQRPISKISPSSAVLMDILHSVLHGLNFFALSAKPPLWKSFLASL